MHLFRLVQKLGYSLVAGAAFNRINYTISNKLRWSWDDDDDDRYTDGQTVEQTERKSV